YDTGSDGEALLTRTSEGYDGVEPCGNSSAALLFLRLSSYGLQDRYYTNVTRILNAFSEDISRGMGLPIMLKAVHAMASGIKEIVVIGERNHPECKAILDYLQQHFIPNSVTAYSSSEAVAQQAESMPLLQGRSTIAPYPVSVFICE